MTNRKQAASDDTDPAPGLRERKKLAVRAAILEAADRLFREKGYDGTSMTDIADAANISRKTLFNYVETKPQVILGLIDAFIGQHMPEWLERDVPHFNDARDIMTPDVDLRLREIAEHRWLLTLAAKHAGFLSMARSKYISDTLDINVVARERRIATVQRAGGMRDDIPAREISRYYEVMRDHAVHLWLLDEDGTADDLHRLFHNAMEVMIRGLEPRSA